MHVVAFRNEFKFRKEGNGKQFKSDNETDLEIINNNNEIGVQV